MCTVPCRNQTWYWKIVDLHIDDFAIETSMYKGFDVSRLAMFDYQRISPVRSNYIYIYNYIHTVYIFKTCIP